MFVDQATIHVKAGKGGDGAVSFYRAKYQPKGGPDGGDGGNGGSVVLVADNNVNTLYEYRGHHHWHAKPGEPGTAKSCHGASAEDTILKVPPGTLVYDDETGELLTDLGPDQTFVVARGGRGGFGNEHFKGPLNQTPREATPGEPGEQRMIRFELKLIADVGLVGLPNAGKSTLLQAMTRANPKIANYPFTTLGPQLGICEIDAARRIVIADIPGLIEGAAEGHGLGHDFLRHIERTRVIAHLIEAEPADGSSPLDNYKKIHAELAAYSTVLAEKPEIIVVSKADLVLEEDQEKLVREIRTTLQLGRNEEVIVISSATTQGLDELKNLLWSMLSKQPETGWAADSGSN